MNNYYDFRFLFANTRIKSVDERACRAESSHCSTTSEREKETMPKGGHIRLTGEQSDEKDQIFAGRSYQVRHLGSSEIHSSEGRGKGCTDEAIREIYSRYSTKSTVKSLTKRELFVSANCVSLYAPTQQVVIFRFPTVNITFCNTSEERQSAFAFVVRDAQTSTFRGHVLHCESPVQANDICIAMHQAFTVSSALYQAKRIERAGWGNGLILSQQKGGLEVEQGDGDKRTVIAKENGEHHETDSNNNFGEIACAVVLPCQTNSCNASEDNSYVNSDDLARYPQRLLNGDNGRNSGGSPSFEKKVFGKNGAGFSLAKMLLNGGLNRGRSQSLPFEKNSSNGEWGCFQSSTFEEEDCDDFSLLARERSSSLKLLTAEMR